uniref:Uncharacterized protein n=2 Tax=Lepeophtheirus salmonis TaxID=72036 RepID=A0A0K2T6U3_LEPSM
MESSMRKTQMRYYSLNENTLAEKYGINLQSISQQRLPTLMSEKNSIFSIPHYGKCKFGFSGSGLRKNSISSEILSLASSSWGSINSGMESSFNKK